MTTGNAGVDKLVGTYCATVRSCCASAGLSMAILAECEATFSGIDEFERVLAGRTVFHEPEFTQCVAWLESLSQTCVLPEDGPCSGVFEGTIAEGGACDSANECRSSGANGVACVHVSSGADVGPGVCRSLSVGQLGSPCFDTIDSDRERTGYSSDDPNPVLGVCDRRDGLYCDYVSSTCQPLLAAGQPCDFEGCVDGLYCDVTCLPKLAAGAPCEYNDQCQVGLGCPNGVCATEKLTDGDLCQGDFD